MWGLSIELENIMIEEERGVILGVGGGVRRGRRGEMGVRGM